MSETPVITYRAQRFAIGHGSDFYGVWDLHPGQPSLVARWPKTAVGWYHAWARLEALERGMEIPNASCDGIDPSTRFPLVALASLVVGLALGVSSLFPSYLGGLALDAQADQLVEHVIYLAGWAAVVTMIVWRRSLWHPGAMFGLGLSALAFGFYLSDLGEVISSGAHIAGAGVVLGLLGWLLCAGGCVLVAVRTRRAPPQRRSAHRRPELVSSIVVLSVGLAITFAPAWDSFHLDAVATGQTASVIAGNAFSNPAPVIAANLVVMVVIVLLALLATIWEPVRHGAVLLAGALVPMLAEFISALVQAATPPGPTAFGISAAQAAETQLVISAGFTPMFYLYSAFLAALVVVCVAWLWNTYRATASLRTVVGW